MTSPIDHIKRSVSDALTNNASKARKTADNSATPNSQQAATVEDTVSLSRESLQVRKLQQQLEQVPEVDAEKVEAIKQAIARGDYPLDPKKIAANLMNLEKILGN